MLFQICLITASRSSSLWPSQRDWAVMRWESMRHSRLPEGLHECLAHYKFAVRIFNRWQVISNGDGSLTSSCLVQSILYNHFWASVKDIHYFIKEQNMWIQHNGTCCFCPPDNRKISSSTIGPKWRATNKAICMQATLMSQTSPHQILILCADKIVCDIAPDSRCKSTGSCETRPIWECNYLMFSSRKSVPSNITESLSRL
jgi:hypothetical protein